MPLRYVGRNKFPTLNLKQYIARMARKDLNRKSKNEGNAPDKSIDIIIDEPDQREPAATESMTLEKYENALKFGNDDV